MKYRKKPVVIEARQLNNSLWSIKEIVDWIHYGLSPEAQAIAIWDRGTTLTIKTLEGDMTASPGDWIIKGVKGEFYPCKPDIFEATYEPVEEKQ